MASTAAFAEVAAMAGDPARAAMLHALMDGRALTASELARVAGIAPQTASGHLARMTQTGLLAVARQGRHRYHRLATPGVARMIEGIMRVASELQPPRKNLSVGPRDAALRQARTCYDHLAGRLGVCLSDALTSAGYAELSAESGILTGRPGISRTGRDRRFGHAGAGWEEVGPPAVPSMSRLERAAQPSGGCRRRSPLRP
jgi:DNA-binding transcriptional ArsR family regulator